MAARASKLVIACSVLCAAATAAAQAPHPRIISLVPALTEMLFAIGAGPQVIGVSSYDNYPPEARKLPRLGALLDPATERILAMRPGLALLYDSQQDLRAQLTRAGIGVFDYRLGGLSDIGDVLRRLGTATGQEAGAARIAQDLDRRLAAVRTRTAGRPKPRTLLVMGREPLTLRNLNASGGVGFLHEVLELAGATNVFADVKRQAVTASNEMLLSRAPDVIIELHYGDTGSRERAERERAVWNSLSSIPAVRNGRVYLLYGDHLVVPGPRIAQAAEEIARAIHPDAFR